MKTKPIAFIRKVGLSLPAVAMTCRNAPLSIPSAGFEKEVFSLPELVALGGTLLVASTVAPFIFTMVMSGYRQLRERKRAKVAQRERDAHLRLVMEQLPAALWTTDTELRLTSTVGAGLALVGLKPHEINGKTLFEYFNNNDPEFLPIAAHTRALKGESVKFEISWQGLSFECYVEPLYDREAQIMGAIGIALDVTPGKRAQEALKQSRRQYDELLNSIEGIVWEVETRTFRFTFVSRQAERLLGYPVASWLNEPDFWKNHLHPDDRDWDLQFCLEVCSSRRIHEFEHRMIAADGRTIWLRDFVTVVSENGEPVKLRGVMVNNTERKRMEEELRAAHKSLGEAHSQLAAIIDHAPMVAIQGYDESGTVSFWNRASEELYGYRAEEVIGKRLGDFLLSERDAKEFEALVQSLLVSHTPMPPREWMIKTASGETCHVLASLFPIRFGENKTQIICMDVDVTPRKRMEAALRQQQEEQRIIFDSVPAMIWYKDRNNNILRANKPAAATLGMSVHELEGKSTYELYPEEAAQYHRDDLEVINSGVPKLGIIEQLQTASGEKRWMQTDKIPYLNENGEIIGVIVFAQDITAAKRAEQEIVRLKDEFVASMSHELRTPLNAILGMAEALQEQSYGTLTEKQRQAVSTIEENGRHLLDLINDVLDLSKIEAGKLQLEIAPVPIESVCRTSLRLFQQMSEEKDLRLSSALDPAVTTIWADERRLKQILMNLLSNAVKFTPKGGAIGLEVASSKEEEVIKFTVWDTGIGISQKDLGRLFQPFVQLDSGLSREYAGTGLGLVLVRRMAELHGGSVTVQSEPGKGSQFTVSLPWRDQAHLG